MAWFTKALDFLCYTQIVNIRKVLTRIFYFCINPFRKLYWFVFRPQTRGVKCIIECQGKFLLTRIGYNHKKFTFPGGGVNRSESWEEAAIREIQEEVGIHLEKVEKIGEYKNTKEYKRDTIFVFHSLVESFNYKIDDIEVVEAGWFSRNELPHDRVPRVDMLLDMLIK